MNLGENIYNLRVEKNLSQGGLADALEVSRQSVSKWENNSAVPELDKLVKMADIFGVTLDELVTGKAQPHPAQAAEPPRPTISAKTLIGITLLCCALLWMLPSSAWAAPNVLRRRPSVWPWAASLSRQT